VCFRNISISVSFSHRCLPPIVELLKGVDASFRPVPHRSGAAASSAFQNSTGYGVEFLTSNCGSADYIDQPANMPALGGASADPLRFLDFLIREPVRTMLLHRSGVPVVVPDPSRYAIHSSWRAAGTPTDRGQPCARRTSGKLRSCLKPSNERGGPLSWHSCTKKHGSAALDGRRGSEQGQVCFLKRIPNGSQTCLSGARNETASTSSFRSRNRVRAGPGWVQQAEPVEGSAEVARAPGDRRMPEQSPG